MDKTIDNFCLHCKAKKEKYIGKIMGSPAVFYRPTCSCEASHEIKRIDVSDHEKFNRLQVPFWKLMGLPPKPKDIAYEKYLKQRNMTYGDAVRERNARATERSSYENFRKSR